MNEDGGDGGRNKDGGDDVCDDGGGGRDNYGGNGVYDDGGGGDKDVGGGGGDAGGDCDVGDMDRDWLCMTKTMPLPSDYGKTLPRYPPLAPPVQ